MKQKDDERDKMEWNGRYIYDGNMENVLNTNFGEILIFCLGDKIKVSLRQKMQNDAKCKGKI